MVLAFLCAAVMVNYDPENIFTISSICCNGQFEYPSEEILTLYRVIYEEKIPFICNIYKEEIEISANKKAKERKSQSTEM